MIFLLIKHVLNYFAVQVREFSKEQLEALIAPLDEE